MNKTVADLTKNKPTPKPAPPTPPVPPAAPVPQQTASLSNPNFKLSATQEDAVRKTIAPCWNIDPGAVNYQSMQIELKLTLNRDGTVMAAEIQDQARYYGDTRYRAAADSARRAVLNDRCHKLPLPPDQYANWQTTYLRFDPKDILQ
jgi:hypothetical protein